MIRYALKLNYWFSIFNGLYLLSRCITVEDDLPYRHNITIDNELTSLDEVKSTLNILQTNLDSCPTLVPLDSKYPFLSARVEDGVINYAKKVFYIKIYNLFWIKS